MNVVAHMTKITDNGITASARIAKFLNARLNHCGKQSTLVHTQDTCNSVTDTVDTLFIINGPMAFSDILPELATLVNRSERVIWVQNDIIIKPPKTSPNSAESPFRKAFANYGKQLDYWTTLPSMVKTPDSRYINWNQLTYSEPISGTLLHEGIVYYGAFREDRLFDFKKYLSTDLYPVHISSTVTRKFLDIAPNAELHSKFCHPLCNDLSKFEATIYMEDYKSHSVYCSPANRFYESLSAGIAQAIDHRAANTLQEADLELRPEWIVKSPEDVAKFLENSGEHSTNQIELWSKDYRGMLENLVDEAIREII